MRRFTRIFFGLFALALCEAVLFAQFDTGSVTGLVKDASGSVVPGAKISLSDAATGLNIKTQSNDAGVYEFPNARVGTLCTCLIGDGFVYGHCCPGDEF